MQANKFLSSLFSFLVHRQWVEINAVSVTIFSDMLDDLFPKKLRLGDPPKPKGKQSLLTMKIQTSPKPKENPFTDFSPYDAYDRPPSESMNVRVLLTALQEFQEPEDSTDSGKTIHRWYFVTNIVLTYCEKKLFL